MEFNKDFFTNNRNSLRKLFIGTAPIVITANGVLQRNGDNQFAFRQDSNFWYLTGIDEPDFILVMDKQKDYLIAPDHPDHVYIFDGKTDDRKLAEISGIETVLSEVEGWRQLGNRLKKAKHVAVIAPPKLYIDQLALYVNPAKIILSEKIKTYNQDIEQLDIRPHLTKLRSIKQPIEIETIKKAIEITGYGFKKVRKNIGKYDFEHQIDADVMYEFTSRGAKFGYQNVIASGVNACTLHHRDNNQAIGESEFVLIDIGAEVNNYTADITRTIFINDKPSKRLTQVYEKVEEVQKYSFGLIKPGVSFREYEKQVEHFMGERLRELGLITTIDRKSVREFFPHANSHFLGLDAHDLGDYYGAFEKNMIITVEPGIYIPKEGIGVRIEDDVILTDDGIDNLSSNLL